MKTYQLALASILVALLLGCSKPERESEAVPKTQVAVEKPAEQPSGIAGQVAEKAEKAKETVAKVTDQAVTHTEELVKKTEAMARKVSQPVVEKIAAAEKSAVKTTTATMDKAEALVEKTTGAVTAAVDTSKTGAAPKVPETITLENQKGKIILPHKKHSSTFACTQCHGDATPGPMELGREKGHALCQGCHKEKGVPTACNDCHEKKAIKAVEGC